MIVYVGLLRGINLGGHNKIPMQELKALMDKLGFKNILTVIQSGNILFKSEIKDLGAIRKTIEQGIKDKFFLDVAVVLMSQDELLGIIDSNPFNRAEFALSEREYFTFLFKKPSEQSVERLMKVDGRGDELFVRDKTVYVLCKKGYARTVFNNNFIERILDVIATSRNLETVKKLADLSASLR
jgi:uncharacterized protein (DUF1697 family)